MSEKDDITRKLRKMMPMWATPEHGLIVVRWHYISTMEEWRNDVDLCADAADEIERLRAERDAARSEVVDRALGYRRDVHWDKYSPERLRCMEFAQQRGWHDLFSEINAKVDAMNTAKKGEE